MSFMRGRSMCPRCRGKIAWYDNIPLLSYVFLGGKCHSCKKAISLRYPLIEVVTSFVFILVYLARQNLSGLFGNGLVFEYFGSFGVVALVFFLVTLSVLICVFVIDLEHQIILDSFSFFGFFITLLFFLAISSPTFFQNILAAFLAALFLLILHLITRGRGMGLGDVKFALMGGMIVGLSGVLDWLFLAFLTGAVVGSILIILGKAKLKQKIAFGPFLVLALVVEIFFGPVLLGLFGLV